MENTNNIPFYKKYKIILIISTILIILFTYINISSKDNIPENKKIEKNTPSETLPNNQNTVSVTNNKDIVFTEKDLEEILKKGKFPITKKDESTYTLNDGWYYNKVYDFKIQFPKNWNTRNSSNLTVVQESVLGNNLINIAVQNISSYKENIRDVRDLYSTKEEFKDMSYKVLMSTVFYDGEIIDYGETYTKDKPFYWLELKAKKRGFGKEEIIFLSYVVFHNNNVYSFSLESTPKEYADIKPVFKKMLDSLSFI